MLTLLVMLGALLLIFVLGAMAAVFLLNRSWRPGPQTTPRSSLAPPTAELPLTGDPEADARMLLSRGSKLRAIARVRELSGSSFELARDFVDALEQGEPPPALTAARPPATPAQREGIAAEARALLNAGRKIEAIKLVREGTGLGLKEAKDYVDDLERGLSPAAPPTGAPRAAPAPADMAALADEARALVAAGLKIEAVRVVRERTGLGLKEALDYVNSL